MAWSKVKKGKKPIGWWYHKVLCEICYSIYGSGKRYYFHLNKLCEYNINLYGDKIKL